MVAVGRWWKETALVLFFRTFDFLLFQIIFNQKEPLNFFLLLFQIIFNQKELFFKKGTIGKVWYIAALVVYLAWYSAMGLVRYTSDKLALVVYLVWYSAMGLV